MTTTQRAEVTAHELLHALGLPHQMGCSITQPSAFVGDERLCPDDAPEGQVRCGPQRSDGRMLVARYGGRVRDFDGFLCDDPGAGLDPAFPLRVHRYGAADRPRRGLRWVIENSQRVAA